MTNTNKFNRDFVMREPPSIGFPQRPVEPDEAPPRSKQCCANCNAFVTVNGPLGTQNICAAGPGPQAVFLGMGETKVLDENGRPKQVPIVWGFWPPVEPERWCRAWQWRGPIRDGA